MNNQGIKSTFSRKRRCWAELCNNGRILNQQKRTYSSTFLFAICASHQMGIFHKCPCNLWKTKFCCYPNYPRTVSLLCLIFFILYSPIHCHWHPSLMCYLFVTTKKKKINTCQLIPSHFSVFNVEILLYRICVVTNILYTICIL